MQSAPDIRIMLKFPHAPEVSSLPGRHPVPDVSRSAPTTKSGGPPLTGGRRSLLRSTRYFSCLPLNLSSWRFSASIVSSTDSSKLFD